MADPVPPLNVKAEIQKHIDSLMLLMAATEQDASMPRDINALIGMALGQVAVARNILMGNDNMPKAPWP